MEKLVNYYQLLEIRPTATDDEVKKALLKKQRYWNTRATNTSDLPRRQEAERNVKLLTEAALILRDPVRRQEYDQKLRMAPPEHPHINETQTAAQQDWVSEGRRFLSEGDLYSALAAANRATQIDGANPEAWALSAQAKFRLGQIPDAVYEYRRAINMRSNEAEYYADLGSVYEAVEDWPSAIQQYQSAARLQPRETLYRALIGQACFNLHRYEEAITTLQQCLAEEPNNSSYRELLALAYCEASYQHWTFVPANNPVGLPENYYATTKPQVDEALIFVQKAQDLQVQAPDVQDAVQSIHVNIKSMLQRHFHGSWLAAGLGVLLGFLLLSASTFWGLFYLVFGVGYAVSCFIPQYFINRRIIQGATTLTGHSDFWSNMFFDGGIKNGCQGMLIGLVIILITLPIVAIVNFTRNWVLAPQPTAEERQRLAAQPQRAPEIVMNQRRQ
jgi:tetratricopeptide (TPR) repeat protein